MSTILVKIFATALTLSQVTVHPENVKTAFDPTQDVAEVTKLLKDGCTHMRRAFDIEDINLDDLIATAMEDPQAVTASTCVTCTPPTASSARTSRWRDKRSISPR